MLKSMKKMDYDVLHPSFLGYNISLIAASIPMMCVFREMKIVVSVINYFDRGANAKIWISMKNLVARMKQIRFEGGFRVVGLTL